MLCLSGFELYSRWVPLTNNALPTFHHVQLPLSLSHNSVPLVQVAPPEIALHVLKKQYTFPLVTTSHYFLSVQHCK